MDTISRETTNQNPNEEILNFKEWDWAVCFEFIYDFKMHEFDLVQIIRIENDRFESIKGDSYSFCIPFSDFNPYKMEEMWNKILKVKDGKITKYNI